MTLDKAIDLVTGCLSEYPAQHHHYCECEECEKVSSKLVDMLLDAVRATAKEQRKEDASIVRDELGKDWVKVYIAPGTLRDMVRNITERILERGEGPVRGPLL